LASEISLFFRFPATIDASSPRLEKERMTTTHNLRLKQLPGKPWLITLATIMATATAAQAVSLGQTDDFEDLTTQNWGIGAAGAQPTVVPSGGPVDDGAFLTYSSDGSGNTGRMLIANSDQWSGDYLAAGVSAITFDVAESEHGPDPKPARRAGDLDQQPQRRLVCLDSECRHRPDH
jgi:hypothetical protein